VHELKTKCPVYWRTVQTTLKAYYSGHYRPGLIALLEVGVPSNNTAHRPVIEALRLIPRHAKAGNLIYYPLGENAPPISACASRSATVCAVARISAAFSEPGMASIRSTSQ